MTGFSLRSRAPSDSSAVRIGSASADDLPPERKRILARIFCPAVQGLLALAVYLAVWLLAETLPLLVHASRPQLDQVSTDPNFYVWNLRWWPYALTHGLNPLHSALIGVPGGYDLAWVTTIPPLALLAWPITAAAGPVVSFNLLVVFSLPVSAWAAFVLCRRLTGRFWPALAGGAVYGFSAYEMNHVVAGQLNLAFSLLLPLMAYLVVLWRDQAISSRLLTGLLTVALLAQFLLFLETFADLTVLGAVALLTGYALAGRSGRNEVARLARLAGLAYLMALVIASPYLVYAVTHIPPGFNRSPDSSMLDLASLVVPRPGQTFGITWLNQIAALPLNPAKDGYVGIPLLVLAGALAVVAWSRRFTRFLVVLLAVTILAALGPELSVSGHQIAGLPWARLWSLPIARSAFPARFMVFGFLILSVMMALWLAGRSWWWWARWLLALLALAAVVVNMPSMKISGRYQGPAFITTGEYRHYLAPGVGVLVMSQRGNAGMLWQAEADFYFRLAGGFVNTAISRHRDVPAPVADFAEGAVTEQKALQFRGFLSQARISAILVEGPADRWPALLGRLGFTGQDIGGVVLYRTSRLPTAIFLRPCPHCRLRWVSIDLSAPPPAAVGPAVRQ